MCADQLCARPLANWTNLGKPVQRDKKKNNNNNLTQTAARALSASVLELARARNFCLRSEAAAARQSASSWGARINGRPVARRRRNSFARLAPTPPGERPARPLSVQPERSALFFPSRSSESSQRGARQVGLRERARERERVASSKTNHSHVKQPRDRAAKSRPSV